MKKLGKVLLTLLIVLAVLFTVLIAPRTIGAASLDHMEGYHYAHRGYHDGNVAVPENSLASFQAAIDAGYGIELDVQLSSDKIPMVFHDADLLRVCGVEGKIWDYTCAELQQMKLFDTEETIPTLQEALALIDGQVPILVEYKMEGSDMFDEMNANSSEDTARAVLSVIPKPQVIKREAVAKETNAGFVGSSGEKSSKKPVKKTVKVGRNDPCPCGSGKKYKKCCGMNE